MNLKNKPLAMAYVPWQMFDEVMDGCGGLAHGTIFEELVSLTIFIWAFLL